MGVLPIFGHNWCRWWRENERTIPHAAAQRVNLLVIIIYIVTRCRVLYVTVCLCVFPWINSSFIFFFRHFWDGQPITQPSYLLKAPKRTNWKWVCYRKKRSHKIICSACPVKRQPANIKIAAVSPGPYSPLKIRLSKLNNNYKKKAVINSMVKFAYLNYQGH